MATRKIIKIDATLCNGCGKCLPNCPEGALQIIDGKARLVSDLFCDGLGACLGHCPQGAIAVEEREAQSYNENKVMANIVTQGIGVIRAHLEHLREHKEEAYLSQALEFLKAKGIEVPREPLSGQGQMHGGCPGLKIVDLRKSSETNAHAQGSKKIKSQLGQWPVQLMLVPAGAPYFKDAELLIAADCVPFAYANFHEDLLKGKILLVGCPKLDNLAIYKEKLAQVTKLNSLKSITYAHMEVPCCFGLVDSIKSAIEQSGKNIPFHDVTISIKGEKLC